MSATRQPVKPRALRPGMKVGVIAPAGPVNPADLERGLAALRSWGYEPVHDESIVKSVGYFAGTVERRCQELASMFECTEVGAIMCARGGYGCTNICPEIDIDIVRRNPKIFLGASDVTALLTWFHDATGLVTFHGPMVAREIASAAGPDRVSWDAVLGGAERFEYPAIEPLIPGQAEGMLYGGCLTLLTTTLGTAYEIDTDDTIVFIEDVTTHLYQLDRMLMHLRLAGKLDRVRGIVFGVMKDCPPGKTMFDQLPPLYRRVLGDLGIPIAYGLNSGHVLSGGLTLPLGVRARLSVEAGSARLELLESAVI